jgi:hypothetical protein
MKLHLFESWILLPYLGEKEGRGKKSHLFGPLVQLSSDLECRFMEEGIGFTYFDEVVEG